MLSDEEKKAIERIDYIQDFIIENGQYNADVNDMEYFSKILNLIEKQSKEIEDYIENKELINQTLGLEKNANINKTLEKIIILNNYEDKIKAKIEEINKKYKAIESNYTEEVINDGDFELDDYVELQSIQYADNVLQSLLEKE